MKKEIYKFRNIIDRFFFLTEREKSKEKERFKYRNNINCLLNDRCVGKNE